MPELGPHAAFILAAYAVAFVAFSALALFTVEDDRKQRRLLTDLERKGIRRRSAAKPAAPLSKPAAPPLKPAAPPGKTTAAKPQATRTPAKRKPAKGKPAKSAPTRSRARKSPS